MILRHTIDRYVYYVFPMRDAMKKVDRIDLQDKRVFTEAMMIRRFPRESEVREATAEEVIKYFQFPE